MSSVLHCSLEKQSVVDQGLPDMQEVILPSLEFIYFLEGNTLLTYCAITPSQIHYNGLHLVVLLPAKCNLLYTFYHTAATSVSTVLAWSIQASDKGVGGKADLRCLCQ